MKSWERVTGPNLDVMNETKAARNKATMENPAFKTACEAVGIPAKKRQASKWNRKSGIAYKTSHKVY